jgi:hypothetical protein
MDFIFERRKHRVVWAPSTGMYMHTRRGYKYPRAMDVFVLAANAVRMRVMKGSVTLPWHVRRLALINNYTCQYTILVRSRSGSRM